MSGAGHKVIDFSLAASSVFFPRILGFWNLRDLVVIGTALWF